MSGRMWKFAAVLGAMISLTSRMTNAEETPAPSPPTPSVASRAWWNQSDIAAKLELTAEQRTQMDTLLRAAIDKQQAAGQRIRDGRRKYEEALKKGDWDAAGKATTEAEDGISGLQGAQMRFKIDVLKSFNAQQRETLISNYPYLLRQGWIRGGGGMRPARGRPPGGIPGPRPQPAAP